MWNGKAIDLRWPKDPEKSPKNSLKKSTDVFARLKAVALQWRLHNKVPLKTTIPTVK